MHLNRRKFLLSGLQIVTVGTAYSIIPKGLWLPQNAPENVTYYTFDVFTKEFQDNLKKKGLLPAMALDKPEIQDKKWKPGQGETGKSEAVRSQIKNSTSHFEEQKSESSERINKLTGYAPQKVLSPLSELKTNLPFDYHVQLVELANGQTSGVHIGPSVVTINGVVQYSYDEKHTYLLHPDFLRYIGNDLFFCYGDVCSNFRINFCRFCSKEYASQTFFYNGVSKLDPYKRYRASYHTIYAGAKCESSMSSTGYHNNETLQEVAGCQCDAFSPRQDQVQSHFF